MPTIQTQQWIYLKQRIDTLVTSPTMPRFDPLALVTAPSDASGPLPFILISDTRNPVDRFGIDTHAQERSGTLMFGINWPIARPISHVQLMEIGGQIAAHFPADQCMGNLRVVRDSDVLQPRVEGPYRICDVLVFWSSI